MWAGVAQQGMGLGSVCAAKIRGEAVPKERGQAPHPTPLPATAWAGLSRNRSCAVGRSWSREWGQGGGSSGLPSGPAPRHHPAAPTPPVAIYSPIFPQKKLLCFIWDAGRFAGQQSSCCEHRLDLPLVGAPRALRQLLGHTRHGTAPAARTRGAPRAAVPAAPWLSPAEHQAPGWVGKAPRKAPGQEGGCRTPQAGPLGREVPAVAVLAVC